MNDQENKSPMMSPISFILVALVLTIVLNSVLSSLSNRSVKEITYTEFIRMVGDGEVESVIFDGDRIAIKPKEIGEEGITYFYTGYLEDPDLLPVLKEEGIDITSILQEESSPIISFILSVAIPVLFIYLMISWLAKNMSGRLGGAMSIGDSKAKIYGEKDTGITFSHVAGQDEAKESLMEIVDVLNNPDKYTSIGAKLPKGALLVGPPGTGKTLLAKAVAGEAGVPFFSITGSDFIEMFVGVGASRVRDLFKQAREKAPCIIFIDEIDAIGKSRSEGFGSNDERDQTLNQLLSEMDGLEGASSVVILAATNRPEVLDKALLRPGRFDRRIIVNQPDLAGRVAILEVHIKGVSLDDSVDLQEIALSTSGASGADLANIVNEAALRAVRMGRKKAAQEDFLEAVELVIVGQQKKNNIMTSEERQIVAYHEIGHALTAAKQKNSMPVQKITIIPRTSGALGYTMQMPEEERYLMTKEQLSAEIVGLLGGRAAEEVKFGTSTTGASNDIERATATARKMVTMYGMSDEFGMMGIESKQNVYLDGRPVANCADETSARVDEVVRRMIADYYDRATAIMRANIGALDEAAEFLFARETITGSEFMEIVERHVSPPALTAPPESVSRVEDDEEA